MNNTSKTVLLSCILLMFTAVYALPQQGRGTAEESVKNDAAVAPNYRLAADDLIHIKIFQEDDLNTTIRISEDGMITFPLIGNVKVGGLTVAEATKEVRDLLNARFIVNPQVTMTVLLYANRVFTVLGQVQRPGTYTIRDKGSITLLQAIGMASGYTRLANTSKITIKRTARGKEMVIELNGKKMANDSETSSFVVLPGDTITVAERLF